MKNDTSLLRLAARPLFAAAGLLAVPLVAMQLTGEVAWTLADFVVMGTLVFGTGLAFELALAKTESSVYRAAVGVALAAGFLLFWVNAAVGLIGAAGNDVNLMYLGVLAVGIVGALVARFRPRGMARAMAATALAQVAVGLVALLAGLGGPASGAVELLALNGFFAALFLGSAWLFSRASPRSGRRADGDAASPSGTGVNAAGDQNGGAVLMTWLLGVGIMGTTTLLSAVSATGSLSLARVAADWRS